MSSRISHKTMRSAVPTAKIEIRIVYILVMGLTGAGKSTFISVVTEDDSIPIGQAGEMDGVTQDVKDYVLDYRQGDVLYEVHLIDSPGFDDGAHVDALVLSQIADFVNTTYRLGHTIAGVIYLHDISLDKLGGVGQRNLRMLEKLVGIDKWDNCTLVTNKWGRTNNPAREEANEKTLRTEDKYFGAMLRHAQRATMTRFDPKSKGKALEIIKPHLSKRFAPHISVQMVDPHGPRLALGDTDAGKVVADNLEKLNRITGELEKALATEKLLARKFDEKVFEEFRKKRDKLIRKHQVQRAERWIGRTAIVGGTIAATVLTMGPGASIIGLEVPFEKFARYQKKKEKKANERLEQDYKKESAVTQAIGGYDAAWLRDRRVKRMQDLESEGYSLNSGSSIRLADQDGSDSSESLKELDVAEGVIR